MRNSFKKLGDKVRGSAFVVPLGFFLSLASIALLIINIRDWYTSWLGIDMIPVYHAGSAEGATDAEVWIYALSRIALSLLPQLFTVIGAYSALALDPDTDEERMLRRGAVIVTLIAIGFDVATGYFYYLPRDVEVITWEHRAWALFMAGLVDTVFSEIAGAWVWGLLLEIGGDFQEQYDDKIRARFRKNKKKQDKKKQGDSSRARTGARPESSVQQVVRQPVREQGATRQRPPQTMDERLRQLND